VVSIAKNYFYRNFKVVYIFQVYMSGGRT